MMMSRYEKPGTTEAPPSQEAYVRLVGTAVRGSTERHKVETNCLLCVHMLAGHIPPRGNG